MHINTSFGAYVTKVKMSRVLRKQTFWFPTWSDTNQAVQLQKIDRGLKFRVKKAEGFYFLCSENKGADQLRGYCEADLRLCFRICKMLVFSRCGSNVSSIVFFLRSVCFIIVPSEIKLSNLTVKNCSPRDNNKHN